MTRTAAIAALVLLAGCGGSSSPSTATPTHRTPGPLADTWGWDGGAWHQTANSGPAPRYSASLAYDAARGVYVMFGGQTAKATSDETWSWDGKTWKALSPAHKPPPRRAAAMAYDPVHRVVVLYGGVVPDAAEGFDASDTWTWDGFDWTVAVEKSTDPGPREGPLMVTAGNRVLLFGGRYYNVKYYGDAGAWDGAAWSKTASGISPRWGAASAQNPDGSALIFGGSDEAGC